MSDTGNLTDSKDTAPAPPRRKYFVEHNTIDLYLHNDRKEQEIAAKRKYTHRLLEAEDLIVGWPNWEVWPFKLAIPVSSVSAAMTGVFINNGFRNFFLLAHYGRLATTFATAGLPALSAGIIHFTFITNDVIQERTGCPVCVQVRAGYLQFLSGFAYPLLLAPLVNIPVASRMKELYFPNFTKEPKEVLRFAFDALISMKRPLLGIGALHIIVAMGMTYFQQECFHKIVYKSDNAIIH